MALAPPAPPLSTESEQSKFLSKIQNCICEKTREKILLLYDFKKKLFHSSTSHTYHYNSSLFLNRHKNIHVYHVGRTDTS